MAAAQPFIMMALIFGVFYFLMIRPQVKKQKEHQNLLSQLKKGDQVITRGGFIGKVAGVADTYLTIELQEKVRVRVLRSYIDGRYDEEKLTAASAKKPTASETPSEAA